LSILSVSDYHFGFFKEEFGDTKGAIRICISK